MFWRIDVYRLPFQSASVAHSSGPLEPGGELQENRISQKLLLSHEKHLEETVYGFYGCPPGAEELSCLVFVWDQVGYLGIIDLLQPQRQIESQ